MAALKLHRTDGGVGATFPNDILDRMEVGEGDTLDLVETRDGILLTRVRRQPSEITTDEVMAAARRIMKDNAAVLRALAK